MDVKRNLMRYYLGIDGGGTSTTAAVANERGKIVGTGRAGPSLYKVVGLKGAMKNLRKAILAAEKKARVTSPSYAYAVFGLSGVDTLNDWKILSALMYQYFKPRFADRFRVVNDVVIALAAGTDAPFGAALIAGTGSNAYAVGPRGEAYAGGLGSVLADEGSAYWIGSQMLRAAVKSFDRRGPETALEQSLCALLKVRTMRDAVDVVYPHTKDFGAGMNRSGFDKTAIARLAPLCTRTARQGDRVAKKIVYDAAHELAAMVHAVVARAGLSRMRFDCVLSGGAWKAGALIVRPFARAVRPHAPRVRFIRVRASPVTGALRLAQRHDVSIK